MDNCTDMTMDNMGAFKQNGYCLRLANGQNWHITATKNVHTLVEKLATIMELKAYKSDKYPKLIFIERESDAKGLREPVIRDEQSMPAGLSDIGWRENDLGALRLWSHRETRDVICEIKDNGDDGIEDNRDYNLDIVKMWSSLYPIYKRAYEIGGLPCHAALVKYNEIGILLAAPGDTGKSTCCRRLPLPWHALCDDETLIVRDHKKQYLAHPFPTWSEYLWKWSGRTWNVQHHIDISAIFFVEQAEEDAVVAVGEGLAALYINASATQVLRRGWRGLHQKEKVECKQKLFDNACELTKSIPAYMLRCTRNGRFWEEMEKILK